MQDTIQQIIEKVKEAKEKLIHANEGEVSSAALEFDILTRNCIMPLIDAYEESQKELEAANRSKPMNEQKPREFVKSLDILEQAIDRGEKISLNIYFADHIAAYREKEKVNKVLQSAVDELLGGLRKISAETGTLGQAQEIACQLYNKHLRSEAGPQEDTQ